MADHKCAFAAPLLAGAFACPRGEPVARRGGPDIACGSAESAARCAALLERLKAAALPAFEVEDDPTRMPHSVLVKIQHGGLLGLLEALDAAPAERVPDVDALAARALQRWGSASSMPAEQWTARMTGYRLRRRRG